MMPSTVDKAHNLVKEVVLMEGSYRGFLHFIIEGKTEVWMQNNEWKCGSVTERRKNKPEAGKFGCVMRKPSKKVMCSHQYACLLFLKKNKFITKEEFDTNKPL